MSKRKDSVGRGKAILLLLMIAVTIGLLFYAKYGTPPGSPDSAPSVPAPTSAGDPPRKPLSASVPRPVAERGRIKWTVEPVPLDSGGDPVQFAVNRFLQSTPIAPEGARLLLVRYEGGVATLDFSPEFARTYSTDDENTLLKGIFESVRLNSDVKLLRFTAGGKPIETLGGYDLTGDQPVTLFADK